MMPYTRQLIEEDDIAAVTAVLHGDWLTCGPTVERFERALAEVVGARHAVACSSGTAALHLACLALGLGPGDRAVVPAMTFLATANAPRLVDADVVFADVDPDTGLVQEEDIERAIAHADGRARAVFPVHLNGQVAPIEAVTAVARRHGLAVVEDACHALGTRYTTSDGVTGRVGDCRFSDATVFSFHPAKTLAVGEGGVVCTNDDGLAQALRRLRNHGIVREREAFADPDSAVDAYDEVNPWYYEMQSLGCNYRLSDIHCALGLSQLGKLERFARRRRELMALYDDALTDLAPAVRPIGRASGCEPVLHLYPVFVDFKGCGKGRSTVMRELARLGIGTQVHYRPVHRQPYYQERYGLTDLPGADAYYEQVLSLPFFVGMADTDVDRVCAALGDVLDRHG